jgi:hypothetical protein
MRAPIHTDAEPIDQLTAKPTRHERAEQTNDLERKHQA